MEDTKPQASEEATTTNETEAVQQGEFTSIILTIDHTSTRKDDHVVQKFVASTQDVTEAMLALFEYYGEEHLLHSRATITQFQELGRNPCAAFVYRTKENVQVVMSSEAFETMVAVNNGSVLGATSYICDAAGELIVTADEAAGGIVPLVLLSFTQEG